jgi:nucleotide-binding universal stress UspA family protein
MMHDKGATAAFEPTVEPRRGRVSRILVGVDFSPVSERALARASDLAEQLGASIVACHVMPFPIQTIEGAAMGLVATGMDLRRNPELAQMRWRASWRGSPEGRWR